MTTTTSMIENPAHAYARLLLRLHDLMMAGKSDSDEADAVRDEMDAPWYAMTPEERERLGGLSADLYAQTEGGPKPIEMSLEEKQQWGQRLRDAFESNDWDEVLDLLRSPRTGLPPQAIPFLQSRCWEGLGYFEVAHLFMRQSEKLLVESFTAA